jgi:hypothetical protein
MQLPTRKRQVMDLERADMVEPVMAEQGMVEPVPVRLTC